MAKKKNKHGAPEDKAKKEKADSKPQQSEDERPFGGLPDRDLKKNLGGCG